MKGKRIINYLGKTAEIIALVERLKSGDHWAAERLYLLFSAAMLQISLRITQDRMASEDILQESFVKSFLRIDSLKGRANYGGWLKRMVVNASIDWVKSRKDWVVMDELPPSLENDSNQLIPDIDGAQINAAIASLPPKCRTVFSLFLMESYSHGEVAKALNISVSTSKSQYQYALKLLRKKLTAKSLKHE